MDDLKKITTNSKAKSVKYWLFNNYLELNVKYELSNWSTCTKMFINNKTKFVLLFVILFLSLLLRLTWQKKYAVCLKIPESAYK